MPNIEVHGLRPLNTPTEDGLFGMIRACLRDKPFAKEAVISFHESVVLDLERKSRPFIRVACTDEAEAQQVIESLKLLGYDIEWLQLRAFFPGST